MTLVVLVSPRRSKLQITDATMANIFTILLFPHTQLGSCLKQLEGEGQGGNYKNNCPDQSMWGILAVDKIFIYVA